MLVSGEQKPLSVAISVAGGKYLHMAKVLGTFEVKVNSSFCLRVFSVQCKLNHTVAMVLVDPSIALYYISLLIG